MQTQKGRDDVNYSELISQGRDLVFGSWRFRWQAIGLAWIVCVACWIFIATMPVVYKASVRLYIDTQGTLRPLLKGLAIAPNLLDEVKVMVNSITSHSNLEKIAIQSGLDLKVQDSVGMDAILSHLRNDMTVFLERSQILEMTFQDEDPSIATSVVVSMSELFIEGLLGSSRSDAESAQNFIETKAIEYEQLLAEAELRLVEFKKQNVGQMPGEQGGYYRRRQIEMKKLELLDLELRLATERRDDLQAQMVGETPVFGLMTTPSAQNLPTDTMQIIALEDQLTELQLQYTESHPDIVRIRALLESLRADLAGEQSVDIETDMAPLDMNPVYQDIRIQFNRSELEVARLSSEWGAQKKLVGELKAMVDTLPEIEAKLTKLNRNYDVNKAQYDALLSRLETARLSEDAEESGTSIKFRVIDPPTVSSSPVGPGRLLLSTLALLVGLAVGAALAIFRSYIEPVFYSSKSLERKYSVPVLGAIQLIRSPAETAQIRRSVSVFSICMLSLIVCYVAVVYFGQTEILLAGRSAPIIG